LLEKVLDEPDRLPSLKTLIIDEAQDLSQLQWRLVKELIERAERTYIAGDDDQAVYTWAGADVDSFLTLEGQVKVLEQSYRVPSKIHALADQVVNRIRKRQPKVWKPRTEGGAIVYYNDFHHVDITQGEWLVLAAANYMLTEMHEWIKSQGLLFERHGQRSIPESVLHAVTGWERLRKGGEIPFETVKTIYKFLDPSAVKRGHKGLKTASVEAMYTHASLTKDHGLQTDAIWHEALTKIAEDKRNYLIALLRRGVKVTGKVPIKLSTIHGAKGGEADNVLLIGDLSTKFAQEYDKNSDDINRLLYVGITRAKQSLHFVLPKNSYKGFRL
jgi:DNA helicase-2/ATP-dependent DNA helicase PcrA